MKTSVVIAMGSQSDLPVMKEASDVLSELGIRHETVILSAHRTPQLLEKSAKQWERSGVRVVIAGAGGAAHLPGMLASFTVLPVIGVPIRTKSLGGLDSLLSIVQMPPGVPVATVAINGAQNAGLLAASILGVGQPDVFKRLQVNRKKMKHRVENSRNKLRTLGSAKFLRGLLKSMLSEGK